MKTRTISNLRPLLRAFYPFLIASAVLWAMPRNASAQLYVTQIFISGTGFTGIVSEYDATTGAVINVNFITGLSQPDGLALRGNTLFVAEFGSNRVGAYDAKTGTAINASLIMGLADPIGLALRGNTLFVANFNATMVGEYDAKTGATINANFITGLGVNGPELLALLGNTLFVADDFGFVGAYDANTGAVIPSFMTITGLSLPIGLAVKSAK